MNKEYILLKMAYILLICFIIYAGIVFYEMLESIKCTKKVDLAVHDCLKHDICEVPLCAKEVTQKAYNVQH